MSTSYNIVVNTIRDEKRGGGKSLSVQSNSCSLNAIEFQHKYQSISLSLLTQLRRLI